MAEPLDEYEQLQWQRLEQWRRRAPSAANRTFSRASSGGSRAVQKLLPAAALRHALDVLQSAAERSADERQILRSAGVTELTALRQLPLRQCDGLADRVRRKGALLGGGTGAALGLAGGIGLALDVPALLIVCFRTIHRVGLCYGEDCADQRLLALGIFALASANTHEEKQLALEAIDREVGEVGAVRDGIERTAERELAKEAVRLSLHRLSAQFARRLGWRLGAAALPVIGAAIGGGVNAWFMNEVALAATYTFQWRRLRPLTPMADAAPLAGMP